MSVSLIPQDIDFTGTATTVIPSEACGNGATVLSSKIIRTLLPCAAANSGSSVNPMKIRNFVETAEQ